MQRVSALFLVLAALCTLATASSPARAQILLVTSDYRVVDLDQDKNRIGVALPESKPNVRQNWVYVRLETEVVRRQEKDGWIRDEILKPEEIWTSIQKGDVIRVQGGRGWDGSITARSIWHTRPASTDSTASQPAP